MDLQNRDYAEALEEERRKILVFQRELPMTLQLVNQEIERCKQLTGAEDASGGGGPVLEEFIPLKPTMSSSSSEESRDRSAVAPPKEEETLDWLRSVQLWNQQPDPISRPDRPQKPVALNARKFGGAFHPFEKEKLVPLQAASSTAVANSIGGGGAGGGSKEKEKEKEKEEEEEEEQSQLQLRSHTQTHRKERRSWSPELHRRFLHALQNLGGSHVATPKQIRELMQVDGLTNDEVKSHLQKYRLHTRRSTPAVESSPQAPQFMVVGGLWVPPPEYAVAAAAAVAQATEGGGAPHSGIYAPVASKLPLEFRSQEQQQQQIKTPSRSPTGPLQSEGRCIHDNSSLEDEGGTNSTSSSSQTVTA